MSEVNMQAVPVIAQNIQMALDYSRNFATAKPNIGLTEKEHIKGLANLLERTALENSALQALLTAADERADRLEGLLRRVIDSGQLLSASSVGEALEEDIEAALRGVMQGE